MEMHPDILSGKTLPLEGTEHFFVELPLIYEGIQKNSYEKPGQRYKYQGHGKWEFSEIAHAG